MKKMLIQIIKFCMVGTLCFLIDYGLMILLTEIFHVYYLISCMISFTVSVVVNYLLSMRFVFLSREDMDKRMEFLLFVVLSLIGLGLNQLLMWLLVDKGGLHYMLSKIVVTVIVMVYNFVTRKLLLEKKTPQ